MWILKSLFIKSKIERLGRGPKWLKCMWSALLYLLRGSAGRTKCCLTVVGHEELMGGWGRPVGESVSGPREDFGPIPLQTQTGKENLQAHGSGRHLGSELIMLTSF